MTRFLWGASLALLSMLLNAAPSLAQSAQLSVPLHRQEHPLSCEAAALQMAMATLGVNVSEDDLLANLARDPTPRFTTPDGSLSWGDPELGFVGNWDGTFAIDGYGVYEQPIADLARAFGFAGSLALHGSDPAQLYAAVRDGNPVVVWMPYGGQLRGRGAWTTPAGLEVDYVVTEHAVVLAGVGDEGVVFADPYTATLQRMSYARFEAAIGELDDRAVIVRST
jgi:uncharacterized protein YvpB